MLRKILSIFVCVVALGVVGGAMVVSAQEGAEKKDSEEIKNLEEKGFTPQPYNADIRFKVGTVIQVDEKDSTKVIAATQDKVSRAFGVVASTNNLPITISNNAADVQVFVATNGRQDVLVTNENGAINAGDMLAVSSLSGTLMKATYKQKILFGTALASFDGKNNTIATTTLKDTKGEAFKQVGIGVIPISIDIRKNPEDKSTKANLPQQLQRLGQLIAEKPVSPFRIYISMVIVTITIVVALVLLYAGVRNAIISIGRNPLSKKSILRALLQVILTSVLVLIIGLFTVYLLLRL